MDSAMTSTMPGQTEDLEIKLLLEALYRTYHYDFRGYSMASIKRRLLQARDKFGCRTLSQLQDMLLHDHAVLPHLVDLLTVQVSDLFRDPDFFRCLRTMVIPHLKTYPSLRVWIAGCSSGEEFYSLAILFREEGLENRTLFYATDINQRALEQAEAGVYDIDRIAQFTVNHQKSGAPCSLSTYYTAAYQGAIFDKSLRRRAVFSDHSLVSDAVFAEVQLILCRNVLIYFDRPLQDRVVGLFNDALVRRGFLGLGTKESLRFNAHRDQFLEFALNERVYRKQGA
jgi:chemotaxis protein methyltransferase CheR